MLKYSSLVVLVGLFFLPLILLPKISDAQTSTAVLKSCAADDISVRPNYIDIDYFDNALTKNFKTSLTKIGSKIQSQADKNCKNASQGKAIVFGIYEFQTDVPDFTQSSIGKKTFSANGKAAYCCVKSAK